MDKALIIAKIIKGASAAFVSGMLLLFVYFALLAIHNKIMKK